MDPRRTKACMVDAIECPSPVQDGIRTGTIDQWDAVKGYGWVQSNGKRFFLHIKDLQRGQRRPKAGDEVQFSLGQDAKGRPCAKAARLLKPGSRMGFGGLLAFGLLILLPGVAGLFLPLPLWLPPTFMTILSVITYRMYAHDKKLAQSEVWRVSEATLHLAELCGGWPGAFLAQRRLRHKCSKRTYQFVFWLIVLSYQIVAVDVFFDYGYTLKAIAEIGGFLKAL
ncbi:MAG: hypothetical protein CFE26_14190 [Verrucomicrobiales bacterium VVV1]|nr:MAG: hypothetical protein CFE26_14190 [Verrucomicrobiales bacterium VVV1]